MLAILLACSATVPRPEPHGAYGAPVLDGVPVEPFNEAVAVWEGLGHDIIVDGAPGVVFVGLMPDLIDHDQLGLSVLDNGDCLVAVPEDFTVDTLAHELGHCLGFLDISRPWHLMSGTAWPGPVMTDGLAVEVMR